MSTVLLGGEAQFMHVLLGPVAGVLAGCRPHMVPRWIEARSAVVLVWQVISMRVTIVPVGETFVGVGIG